MNNRSVVFLSIILSLTIGVFIYGITRTESIYLNQWLGIPANGKVLDFLQDLVQNSQIPDWIIYSLPDALWMFALILLILLIWDFKLHRQSIPWLIVAALTGVLFEISQRFQFMRGTFDFADLWCIGAGAFIPILFTCINQRQNKRALTPSMD